MMKYLSKPRFRSGMTLIELVVVIGILGILFAAVYMFFVKGTEQFHFTRRQNQLATTGRLALEILSDEIIWAGYMPYGGWTEEEWQPVEVAENGTFNFYADRDGNKILTDSDYRNIYLDAQNVLRITDDDLMNRVVGTYITAIQFNYLDAGGIALSKPLGVLERGAVRHIVIKLTLEDSYMGEVYQTVMQTMITPRNLGVYHNFDPLFYLPPPPDAKIVVNVDGSTGAHLPTVDQDALLHLLDGWGFTLVALSDDELSGYDYDSSGVDLVILRNLTNANDSHAIYAGLPAVLIAIPIPIILLDPDDAEQIFLMGEGAGSVTGTKCELYKYVFDHPIHEHVPDTLGAFEVYKTSIGANIVTTLDSLYPIPLPGTELITSFGADTVSGVSVINQVIPSSRRIHYCAPDFANYSQPGKVFLYNVIMWTLPEGSGPPLGEEINIEGFEGDSPGEIPVVFWSDDLEGGILLPDSIPLYTDFGTGAKSLVWMNSSTGLGEINNLADLSLEMQRTVSGAFDRNIASTVVDLSAYNAFSDELYITIDSWKGTSEAINAEDGVFLMSVGGSIVELLSQDFETLAMSHGDVEFWGDLYGRQRIHSPEPAWNNATTFVTLDSRINGASPSSRSRMMIEIDTSALEDGTQIIVNYRMTDHRDETHSYNASDNSGDYIGWSLGNGIDDSMEDYENLEPGSKTNGVWSDYIYAFTPSGSMPSTVYIIFSQHDDDMASSATGSDGISFDDITIYADNTTQDMSRIGTPVDAADWQKISVDLDDAAISNAVPFAADFGLALSQYGMGPWATYGMHWRYFELGVIEEKYTLPGWHHEPMITGGIDDWSLEDFSGNHKWTLHANDPANYSNDSYCWLETPKIAIPDGTTEPILSFVHSYSMDYGWDYGWIEISTNGGTIWNVFETDSYGAETHNGHGAYTGTMATSTVELDLESYVGQVIQFRFVFESDGSGTMAGWTLDNFEASGTISGIEIKAIGFKPTTPGGSWYFNEVDVYLGSTTQAVFLGDGELDKSDLTYFGTYEVGPTAADWVVIDLLEDYILPSATNLIVKLEMNQISPFAGYTWVGGTHPNTARWEVSLSGDPSYLKRASQRPAFMIETDAHGDRFVDADSTLDLSNMPLSFSAFFGDFEAIYTPEDLGFSGETPWVTGGLNNDWEIGVPLFAPDVDPAMIPRNENRIAGTDLTDDGYYTPNAEWNWIRSGAYEMADATVYDSVAVSYDRCLRRAFNDLAFVQMAFTTSIDPPDPADWIMIKKFDYDDDIWHSEVLQLTPFFQDAIIEGKTHYFIRFVLSAGPFAEKGGWNIDNVGFYGRYEN